LARRRRIAVLGGYVVHLSGEVLGGGMSLPPAVIAQLRALQEQLIAVGDIWWLPEDLARYPGKKDRFCLVVALEYPAGGSGVSPLVHYVVGSTSSSVSKTIKVRAGESGLNEDTYFRFWWSGSIAGTTVAENGKWKGRLAEPRGPEIEAAIRASKLAALKRLLP